MFRKLLFLLFLNVPLWLSAQVTTVKFAESEYNFGFIKEENGQVKHVFYFTNTGNSPLTLVDVKGSCGCTIPTWNKSAIAPGKKDSIVVSYNPTNRPGAFQKTVTIIANTEPSVSMLTIKGFVEVAPKSPEQEYIYEVGQVRFEADYVNFGTVPIKDPVVRELKVYNQGETPVTFVHNTAHPAWVKVAYEPATLPAKGKGVIRFTYNPKHRNEYGYVADPIEIITNETQNNKKKIILSGNLVEYFPPLTADQMYNQPKASWVATEKNLGTVQPNSILEFSYDVVNTGKQDLIIRSVKPTCFCTTAKADKLVIKPGETGHILATFNTAGLKGNQQKVINVMLNDASASQVVLYYKAVISDQVTTPMPKDSLPANGQ